MQIVFSRLIIILLLALEVLIGLVIWRCVNLVPGSHSINVYAAFPLIAIVLIYLAIKAIRKDDKLVKSTNRIR